MHDTSGHSLNDDLAVQLASAGPTGVAAAAAISSTKKRKRPHAFETNPSIRKRQQTRLLRKLKQNIEEYSLRVGQQAVVLVAAPGKSQNCFRAFGAKPLEDVIKNLRAVIMSELENALAQQAPPIKIEDPSRHEMPPLVIDGIPTPVEKMTQAQLRAFIPLMLKYSTGRGKPGWGKDTTKPVWWPKGVPWANVRMDARENEDKQKVSWTHALRQIVINCYKYHGREDLLPVFNEDEATQAVDAGSNPAGGPGINPTGQQPANDATEKKPTIIHNVVSNNANNTSVVGQYTPTTVVQTIANPDGTVSIIHVDPNNPVITLPDGTTAQVQGVAQMDPGQGAVHTLAEVASQHSSLEVGHSSDLQENGHIIITGDDGQAYPLSGMITVPVSAGTYQAVVASMQQGGGLTFHTAENANTTQTATQAIQLISAPLQLANGQIIAKVETTAEAEAVRQQQSSIQNLVTKVMQSGTGGGNNTGNAINEVTKPATLTITPVGSSSTTTTTTTSCSGPVIQMVANSPIPELKRMRSQVSVRGHEQPDTTESLD